MRATERCIEFGTELPLSGLDCFTQSSHPNSIQTVPRQPEAATDEWESCRVVMKQHYGGLAVRPGEKEHTAGHSPPKVQSPERVKWPSAVLSDQSVPGLPAPHRLGLGSTQLSFLSHALSQYESNLPGTVV